MVASGSIAKQGSWVFSTYRNIEQSLERTARTEVGVADAAALLFQAVAVVSERRDVPAVQEPV